MKASNSHLTRSLQTFFVLSLAVGWSQLLPAAEPEWTGWLGPQRDGWVSYFQTPTQWPAKLDAVWETNVGTGYGSPLVAQGRVFQHARQAEEEVAWCIDLQTGKVLWRQTETTPFEMGGGGERHGKGPKSCPVFADGRFFTMSIVGTLIARTADTGKVIWKRDYRSVFPKSHPYWGFSASPIVVDELIIVHFGNDDAGTLVALDTKGQRFDSGNRWHILFFTTATTLQVHGRSLTESQHTIGRICVLATIADAAFSQRAITRTCPLQQFMRAEFCHAENRGYTVLNQYAKHRWRAVRWQQPEVALDMSTAVMNDGLLYGSPITTADSCSAWTPTQVIFFGRVGRSAKM